MERRTQRTEIYEQYQRDGQVVASASKNRAVRIWNAITGEDTQKFQNVGYAPQLAFSTDDRSLGIGMGISHITQYASTSLAGEKSVDKTRGPRYPLAPARVTENVFYVLLPIATCS